MKKQRRQKLLAWVLTLAMAFTMLPASALAAEPGELTCDKTEHTHTEACYETTRELACGQEESEDHSHTDDCYTEANTLICGLEEHIHTVDCYAAEEELPETPEQAPPEAPEEETPETPEETPAETEKVITDFEPLPEAEVLAPGETLEDLGYDRLTATVNGAEETLSVTWTADGFDAAEAQDGEEYVFTAYADGYTLDGVAWPTITVAIEADKAEEPVTFDDELLDDVYVKNDGTGDGSAEDSPIGSLSDAYDKVADGGTIHVIGTVDLPGVTDGASSKLLIEKSVTFDGGDGATLEATEGNWVNSAINASGTAEIKITFYKLTIDATKKTGTAVITNWNNDQGGIATFVFDTVTVKGSTESGSGDLSFEKANSKVELKNVVLEDSDLKLSNEVKATINGGITAKGTTTISGGTLMRGSGYSGALLTADTGANVTLSAVLDGNGGTGPALVIKNGATVELSGSIQNFVVDGIANDNSDKQLVSMCGNEASAAKLYIKGGSIKNNDTSSTRTTNSLIGMPGNGTTYSNNVVVVEDGSIKNNNVRVNAVSISEQLSLTVLGTVEITNNKTTDEKNKNVLVSNGQAIIVNGLLEDDSSIGVETAKAPEMNNPVVIAKGGTSYAIENDLSDKFTSDKEAYMTEYSTRDNTIVLSVAEAKIGDTKYKSLSEALTAATTNSAVDTITLLTDPTVAATDATLKSGDTLVDQSGNSYLASAEAKISVGTDSKVTLTEGALTLSANAPLTANGVAIVSGADNQVVTMDRSNAVVGPMAESETVAVGSPAKTYTSAEANTKLSIGTDGKVTVSAGSVALTAQNDMVNVAASTEDPTRPAFEVEKTDGAGTVTVTSDGQVTIPAETNAKVNGVEITGDDTADTTVEVGSDGSVVIGTISEGDTVGIGSPAQTYTSADADTKLTVASDGTVTVTEGAASMGAEGQKVTTPIPASGGTEVTKTNDTGTVTVDKEGAVTLTGGASATIGDKAYTGASDAAFVVDADGSVSLTAGSAILDDDKPLTLDTTPDKTAVSGEGATVTKNADGSYAINVPDGKTITVGDKTYTGPVSLVVASDGTQKTVRNEVLGVTAYTITFQGEPDVAYTIGGAAEPVTADSNGRVTFENLDKNTEYKITSIYGIVAAKTAAVDGTDIAKAFDKDASSNETDKVEVTTDENGNYKVTLKQDITPTDTGATAGAPTVQIGDNWGTVSIDLGGYSIKGTDADASNAATPGMGFTSASGTGTDLTVTGNGTISGGSGSAEHPAGAAGITTNGSSNTACSLTLNSGVTVSGGAGATATNGAGGNGGFGIDSSDSLNVTVNGASINGGAGAAAASGDQAGGNGGNGIKTNGNVTIENGRVSAGNGGAGNGAGAGGNGGAGVDAGSTVVNGGTLTGGNGGTSGTGTTGNAGVGAAGTTLTVNGGTVLPGSGEGYGTVSASRTSITITGPKAGVKYQVKDSTGTVVAEATAAADGNAVTLSGLSANTRYTVEAVDGSNTALLAALNTTSSSGGGGGGSSSSSSSTSAKISSTSHGKVTVNPTSASSGTKVTITATPDSGYEVGEVTVTDSKGNSVKVTDSGNNKFTFTQPANAPVTIAVKFVASAQASTDLPFDDVDDGDWFYDAVKYVYDNGLMAGTSSDTFSPYRTTTRGMIVTILYRLEGEPSVAAASFSDVTSGQYYTNAVAWAAANGIVTGYTDGSFRPNTAITREQMATILYRYANYKGYDTTAGGMAIREYEDYDSIGAYALAAMDWANAAGLINGTSSTTLSPKGQATRAQVSAILMRFCENIAK